MRKPDATRGRELFEAMNCSMCHPGGDNALNPTKPLRGAVFRKMFPNDGDIARLIRSGVKDTSMDSFDKSRLSDEQLYDIIAFIRSLPQPDAVSDKRNANARCATNAAGTNKKKASASGTSVAGKARGTASQVKSTGNVGNGKATDSSLAPRKMAGPASAHINTGHPRSLTGSGRGDDQNRR